MIHRACSFFFSQSAYRLRFTLVELLQAVVRNKDEFVLEVTDRHVTDVTGSILVAENDRPRLLETSQIPQPLVRVFAMCACAC